MIGFGVEFNLNILFPSFASGTLCNPKDDKTQDDAIVNFHLLECPERIILLKLKTNLGNLSNATPRCYCLVNGTGLELTF